MAYDSENTPRRPHGESWVISPVPLPVSINDGTAVVEDRACAFDIRVQRGIHAYFGRSACPNFDVDRRTNEVFSLVVSCRDQANDNLFKRF